MKRIMLFLIFFIPLLSHSGGKFVIVTDGSGSMEGYFKGGYSKVYDSYYKVISGYGDVQEKVMVANTDEKPGICDKSGFPYRDKTSECYSPSGYGQRSPIYQTFQKIIDLKLYDGIFLLTDNGQTNNNTGKNDRVSEYLKEKLPGSSVYVIPEKDISFSGKPYNPCTDKKMNSDAEKKGLIVYCVFPAGGGEELLDELRKEGKLVIKAYPYTDEDILFAPAEDESEIKENLESAGLEYEKTDWSLNTSKNGMSLTAESSANIKETDDLTISFYTEIKSSDDRIRFKNISNMGGIKIDRAVITEENGVKNAFEGSIYPESLTEGVRFYRITLKRKGKDVSFKKTINWKAGSKAYVDIVISMQIKPGQMMLKPELWQEYFTGSCETADKIYLPTEIISYLQTKPVVISTSIKSELFILKPQSASLLIISVGSAVLAAVIFWFMRCMRATVKYRVDCRRRWVTIDIRFNRKTKLVGYGTVTKKFSPGRRFIFQCDKDVMLKGGGKTKEFTDSSTLILEKDGTEIKIEFGG